MKMIVNAELKGLCGNSAKIAVNVYHETDNSVPKNLIPEFCLSILRGMRDAHTDDFRKAMLQFAMEELEELEELER